MNKDKCKPVDIELAHKLLRYDPNTGLHHWLVDRPNGAKVGDIAGYFSPEGYVRIMLFGKGYYAHRLGYAMFHNDNLDGYEVNHISHDRSDNSIQNLMKVDSFGQNQDTALRSNNKTGVCGVHLHKVSKSITYRVRIGGNSYGCYSTLEEARLCTQYVYKALGYSPNHGRPLADIQRDPA